MERVYCAHCCEVIGVYEPMRLILSAGGEFTGSLLTLGSEFARPGAAAVHETCYPRFLRWFRGGVGRPG